MHQKAPTTIQKQLKTSTKSSRKTDPKNSTETVQKRNTILTYFVPLWHKISQNRSGYLNEKTNIRGVKK